MTDLYRVLGVSRHASASEIKSAYRRRARKLHPDVSSSPDSNARFAKLSDAYRVLIDSRLRAQYDRGEAVYARTTFYASRDAEVVFYQRKFDRIVDEMIARERQETAARSHAVSIVVPLFLSAFYVALTKPRFIQDMNIIGRLLLVGIACYALHYLVKNLAIVLGRYTYHIPDHVTSLFREEAPHDKHISRKAGLVFLVCGYLVSLGLGLALDKLAHLNHESYLAPATLTGVLLYPPIAVLIIGCYRRVAWLIGRPFRVNPDQNP